MKILLRKDAIKQGLKRYFNGVPCPRGHIAERLVKGGCLVCDRADTLVRARANSEGRARRTREYRALHPEKADKAKKNWNAKNPARVKALKSASQKRNRASANERQRRYVEANKEAVYARTGAWSKANPAKTTAKTRRYQTTKLQRTPKWADQDEILGMYELAALFRNAGLDVEVDHEIPLRGKTVSGLHVANNLQLIHSAINKSKSNHFIGA